MSADVNAFGQPIGPALPGWTPRPVPPRTPMQGRFCRLEPLDAERHAADLFEADRRDADGRGWTYMSVGPFPTFAEFQDWIAKAAASIDPMHHAIIDLASGKAVGSASFMRIDPANGVIEVGFIKLSPLAQRTTAATEAMALMMARAFDELGYRRTEWKCDDLNRASKAAARRLGFTPEGLFRNATIYKGRSRDTAWFSIIDSEWPALKRAFAAWLAPDNFDAGGRQVRRLEEMIGAKHP